ncbi:unnamed protein product [Polarella glacialis]|uniref:Transmembrane protein n=1 Tax=Polarella glacialis TaxID=89957 RepID=A0A813F3H8_POLGL|nr:unnamed protein product [Polarella glacialis]
MWVRRCWKISGAIDGRSPNWLHPAREFEAMCFTSKVCRNWAIHALPPRSLLRSLSLRALLAPRRGCCAWLFGCWVVGAVVVIVVAAAAAAAFVVSVAVVVVVVVVFVGGGLLMPSFVFGGC